MLGHPELNSVAGSVVALAPQGLEQMGAFAILFGVFTMLAGLGCFGVVNAIAQYVAAAGEDQKTCCERKENNLANRQCFSDVKVDYRNAVDFTKVNGFPPERLLTQSMRPHIL